MMRITSRVTNGKLCGIARDKLIRVLKRTEGRFIDIEVSAHKKKVSNPQHRYYRGVIIPAVVKLAKDGGDNWSSDDANDWCKRTFGLNKDISASWFGGDSVTLLKSTADYTVDEMSEYCEFIRAGLAKYVQIPLPREVI